jgi:hypothetical protein
MAQCAETAGCARSTVTAAIHSLEEIGHPTGVNRVKRLREVRVDYAGGSPAPVRPPNGCLIEGALAACNAQI